MESVKVRVSQQEELLAAIDRNAPKRSKEAGPSFIGSSKTLCRKAAKMEGYLFLCPEPGQGKGAN